MIVITKAYTKKFFKQKASQICYYNTDYMQYGNVYRPKCHTITVIITQIEIITAVGRFIWRYMGPKKKIGREGSREIFQYAIHIFYDRHVCCLTIVRNHNIGLSFLCFCVPFSTLSAD